MDFRKYYFNIVMAIRRYFNIIIKRKKISRLLLIIVIVLLASVFFSKFAFNLSDAGSRAALLEKNPSLTKLLPLYWKIRKISDLPYFFYYFKKDNVPIYELIIDDKARKKMDDSLPQGFMGVVYTNKVFAPAKFKYNGKTYDVKVRYRGDNAIHWNAPQKSYLVEFDKNDLFNGLRRVSFIIARDRNFSLEYFNNYRAGKLGLMVPESGFANLKINGRNNGLYFMIENWGPEMLAKWEVPDESNFYGDQDPEAESGIIKDYGLWDNLDPWQLVVEDTQFSYQHFSELSQLLSLLHDSDDQNFYNSIFDLVDEDSFYAWQIHQELANSGHQVTGNTRLYFNDSAGKFYFIPWDLEGFPAADNANLYNQLAQRIFSNPQYLYKKNQKLYDYVSNGDNLKADLDFYDKTTKYIKTALYRDRLKIYTNRWASSQIAQNRQYIIDNVERLKNSFNDNLVFVEAKVFSDNKNFQNKNILASFDFSLKTEGGIYLKDLKPKFSGDFNLADYHLYYDANSNNILDAEDTLVKNYKDVLLYSDRSFSPDVRPSLKLTQHRFYLVSNQVTGKEFSGSLENIDFDLENAITAEKIKSEDIGVKITNQDAFKYFSNIYDVSKFELENPAFRVNRISREITLLPGVYAITKTTIVPKGFTLKIMPGSTLIMSPGISIVSYSNVIAAGTASQPINFVAQDANKPWGVFGVLNSGQENIFSYVKLSDGKDDYINGVYFSAMLSIYHSDAKIDHCEFTGAKADDSLNVKSASAQVVASKFINNSADAIDFDFIKVGEVSGSEFDGNGNDSIDLSGSSVKIINNYIKNSGDKCISVGERSLNPIIYNNVLNHCHIGLETKDLSEVIMINNVIINNQIGINAYQKKPVFGGGQATVYNSIIWGNQTDIKADPQSKISVFYSDVKDLAGQDNNFSLKPSFTNPDARDFTIKASSDNMLFVNGGNSGVLKDKLDINLSVVPVGLNP